jgi:hypothetical protein
MTTDVDRGFSWGFETAVLVDGKWKNFRFSDGQTLNGRIPKRIECLWITDQFHTLHTHAKRLNTIVHNESIQVYFRECDAPCGATLYSNAYIDVDEVSYRIETSKLECQIWGLTLELLGTD